MTIRTFIKENRKAIDEHVRRRLNRPDAVPNDEERRQWIANDEGLYTWARFEGVRV